jgi:hypothetical protein
MHSAILDLETLDTKPTSLITEIGLIIFNREDLTVIDHVEIKPDFFAQLAAGRTFDPDTIAFHRKQGTLPQLDPSSQTDLHFAAAELAQYFREYKPVRVWIQGTCFDRPIVEDFYRSLDQPLPWHFTSSRDARTAWDIAFPNERHPKRGHKALDDCQDTLTDLTKALKKLNALHTI